MKRKIAIIASIIIMFFSTSTATALWIDNVEVVPVEPLDIDIITFNIDGRAGGIDSQPAYDQFAQDGTALQLDLYFDAIVFPVITNWTYSREILPLSADAYTLEVRAFDNYSGILADTYTVDFTVVPEPATFVLFGLGGLFLRKRS